MECFTKKYSVNFQYDLLTKKLEKHRESLTKKAEVEKKSGDAEASTSTAAAVAPKVDPLAKAKSIHGGKYAALYEKVGKTIVFKSCVIALNWVVVDGATR